MSLRSGSCRVGESRKSQEMVWRLKIFLYGWCSALFFEYLCGRFP